MGDEQGTVYTVTDLTSRIRTLLEEGFGDVWVRGEISNFVIPSSGHYYFTLKDAGAQLRAVCFRNSQRRVPLAPKNGMEVLARGRISVYEPRGEYQLIVSEMMDYGLGKLQRAFEQLKERLRQEGLFDPGRKRKLPLFPSRIGVVTSPTGAAIRDILRILGRRNSAVRIQIYPVKVQGEGAAGEIAAAIGYFNRRREVDALIVGRGGGSLEDLWAFNEEIVARAVHASAIPVVSAVGHETDFTICDFVADLRAPTPSAAAELVAGAAAELTARVDGLVKGLRSAWESGVTSRRHRLDVLRLSRGFAELRHRLSTHVQRVDELQLRMRFRVEALLAERAKRLDVFSGRLALANPGRRLQLQQNRLDVLSRALRTGMADILTRQTSAYSLLNQRLQGLSPVAALARGYALCLDAAGRLVRSGRQVNAGDAVTVHLMEGALDCRVEKVRSERQGEG